MMEYLEINSAPSDEDCVQVSTKHDYVEKMLAECKRYKTLLDKKFENFERVRFKIKEHSHDFGCIYEVCIAYSDSDYIAGKQAFYIENHLPKKWSDTSKVELPKFKKDHEEEEDENE